MYSVVLMAALATSSSAPDFGHRHGCSGGYSGCYGGCYGGNYGYGCGCGGYGSGYGGYCYGSYGYGGYGCSGYGSHCFGQYSGWNSYGCYGCSGYGGWSCAGGWGGYAGTSPYGYWSCSGGGPYYGCYGGYSGYGVPVTGQAVTPYSNVPSTVTPNTVTPSTVTPKAEETPLPTPLKKKDGLEQSRVKVRIDVPADAKLYVDDMLVKSGAGVRVFQTPELDPTRTYFYDVRVELTRNGQTLSETQRLIIRPGQDAAVSFAGLEQRAAATTTAAR